jgi:hypothetical protein
MLLELHLSLTNAQINAIVNTKMQITATLQFKKHYSRSCALPN